MTDRSTKPESLPEALRPIAEAARARRQTPEGQAEYRAICEEDELEFGPPGPPRTLLGVLSRMKAERLRLSLRLEDVSKRSGLDPAMISRLERGQLENPTISTLDRYAAAIGQQFVWKVVPVEEPIAG